MPSGCYATQRRQKRAFNQMGVSITEEEAVTIVKYYDIDGSGEMSYDVSEWFLHVAC